MDAMKLCLAKKQLQYSQRRRLKRYTAKLERALEQIANVIEECESMHGPIEPESDLAQIERILVRTWGSTHKPKP